MMNIKLSTNDVIGRHTTFLSVKCSGVIALLTQATQTSDEDVVHATTLRSQMVIDVSEWTDDTSIRLTTSPLVQSSKLSSAL